MKMIDLSKFNNAWYKPGRKLCVRFLWIIFHGIFINSWFPWPYAVKKLILEIFGAKIGRNFVVKASVRVKYPWNLIIGNNCWIGEDAWIDSLGKITIGNNVCLSQGCMLETGSHDHEKITFDLIVKEIKIEDGAWIGAKAIILPGSTIKSHAVITAGAVFSGKAKVCTVYIGNPAVAVYKRNIR